MHDGDGESRAFSNEWSSPSKRLKVGDRVWEYVCKNRLLLSRQVTSDDSFKTVVTVFGRKLDVLVTSEAAAIEDWIARQQGTVFGMDLEWKPNRVCGEEENKVALLQICGELECLIVQMIYLDRIPSCLVAFLRDCKMLLGGIGIKKDAEKLRRDYDLNCKGLVELGVLAVEKLRQDDLRNAGLKGMAGRVLGLKMDKPKRVTLSNWAIRYLGTAQINYACADAWVSYAILDKLLNAEEAQDAAVEQVAEQGEEN